MVQWIEQETNADFKSDTFRNLAGLKKNTVYLNRRNIK